MRLNFTPWEPIELLPVIRIHAGHPFLLKDRLDEAHNPDDVFVKINYTHDDDKQLIYNLASNRFKLVAAQTDAMPGNFTVERVIEAKPFTIGR